MFNKFSISGINALTRLGIFNNNYINILEIRPVSKVVSLYIHVPFCKSICHFCMLRRGAKVVSDVPQLYIDSIIADIGFHKRNLEEVGINSIYFGGGTPSMLNSNQ